MSRTPPPFPQGDIKLWSRQLYDYLLSLSDIKQSLEPTSVLLSHRLISAQERAVTDGLLLYDPVYQTPVYSRNGAWYPLSTEPRLVFRQAATFATNGPAIVAGGDKIKFGTAIKDDAAWGSFDDINFTFTLLEGTYYIEGYATVATTSAVGTHTCVIYAAVSTALTTTVGNVVGGVVSFGTSPNNNNEIVPFMGEITVPSGGETYAMVFRTASNDLIAGYANNIASGVHNRYAQCAISLIKVP